ncbi:MAG: ATP-binding protein [Pseudothermotoga sp.]
MLFSLTPKAKKEDLFDRGREFEELDKLLRLYPIVVVSGLRRVGKSSLVRVFLNETNRPHVFVDGRRLYESSKGNISLLHLSKVLKDELSKFSKSQLVMNFISRIRGITVNGSSLEINPRELDLGDLFEKFNEIARKQNKHFVIFFDEAQYLRYYGSKGGNDLLALLACTYDHLESVRILITGSEIGALHDFLKLEDYNSQLYGRGIGFLTLKPFSPEESARFLQRGFEELNEKVDFDIQEVVQQLDGTAGYLVLFGIKYLENKDEKRALAEVFHTARSLFEKEISELIKRNPRYIIILKQIANGQAVGLQ